MAEVAHTGKDHGQTGRVSRELVDDAWVYAPT